MSQSENELVQEPKEERERALDALPRADLAEAKRRFEIIKHLVRTERRSDEDVRKVASAHGVSRATVYAWIKSYEGRRLMTDLAPRRRGRPMPQRLPDNVEAIVASAIKDLYLSKQKASGEAVIVEVEGLTGETCKLLTMAAEVAIRSGREIIDTDTLDDIPWTAPSERRRGAK